MRATTCFGKMARPLRVQNRMEVQMHPWMLVETTRITDFEYYFACTRKGVHESWQNDVCSFRAMNVALLLQVVSNVVSYACIGVSWQV